MRMFTDRSTNKITLFLKIFLSPAFLSFMLLAGCSDDSAANRPLISIDDISQSEGDTASTSFDFQVMLSETSSSDVTVEYHTEDGTAMADTDYTSISDTLTIPAGSTSGTISIQVNGDMLPEQDETFSVVLSSATKADMQKDRATGTIINDDQLSASIDDQSAVELDTGSTMTMFFTISLSAPAQEQLTVDYITEDDTASYEENDYEFTSGSAVFDAGQQTQTVGVKIIGDDLYEGNEMFHVRISNPNLVMEKDLGTGTIENNDNPPVLTIDDASLSEADCQSATMDFNLHLNTPSGLPASLSYETADGTATVADSDYQTASGTLSIAAGETNATISVNINCDDKGEADESFKLNLFDSKDLTIDDSQALGTILNDDGPASMSIADTSVEEGDSGITTMVFTVSLSQPLSSDESVDYTTADGTATSSSGDYVPVHSTLTIPAGQTEGTIQVEIHGDTIFEADEVVNMVLSNSSSVEIADAEAQGLILNDDDPPVLSITAPQQAEGDSGMSTFVFTASLSAAAELDVSVQYATEDGTATISDGDYLQTTGALIIPSGSTSGTIEVSVAGDTRYEPDETFSVLLSDPVHATISQAQATASIMNDDAIPELSVSAASIAEGTDAQASIMTFTVSLSSASGMDVSVDYATSDQTASASDADYQAVSETLLIPAGNTSGEIQVVVLGDDLYEPDETFLIALSNPANATLANTQATGTILNDDPMQSLSIADVSGDEGSGRLDFIVTLSGEQGVDVSFDYTSGDGTATTSDGDYNATSGGAVIPAGQTSAVISIDVTDDNRYEEDETFTLSISLPAQHAMATIADGTATGTITNDDPMPSLSIADQSISEGDSGTTQLVFTVSLSAVSGADTDVDYSTSDITATVAGGDYSGATGKLGIPAGTSSSTITVVAYGDDWYEDDETFGVDLSNPVNATLLDDTATGTIINDDSEPTMAIMDASMPEGTDGQSSDMLFSVQLSNPSGFGVSVNYFTADGSATIANNDYLQTSGTLNFAPGETTGQVAVSIIGDDTYELDENFSVGLSNPTGATVTDSIATGLITNDDPALYFVDPTGDDTDGMSWQTALNTVQQGVDAAEAAGGGQVWVAAATYTNGGGNSTVVIMKSGVSIFGGFEGYSGGTGAQEAVLTQRDWEQNQTILDGTNTAYHVLEGADNASIDGFTITNGNATDPGNSDERGGGIYNNSASPQIANCKFLDNVAVQGGAIFNYYSQSPTITGCLFSNNTATSGAAIRNWESSPSIYNCTFDSNTSPSGSQSGIIYNQSNSAPDISFCTFSNNNKTAILNMANDNGSVPIISDCIFWENNDPVDAGAMYNFQSSPVVDRCYFWSNSSGGDGGAINNYNASPIITNCVFSGNSSGARGGALNNRDNSFPIIVNCTFYANSANQGGAISNDNSASEVTNSILWANTAGSDPSVHNENIFRVPSWAYSDVEGCGGDSSWQNACGWNKGGCIDQDPLFVDADGPDNNPGGGDDDLSLDTGSPCRDSADGDSAPASDIMGAGRHDDPGVANTGTGTPDYVDMGAYEAQ